MQVEAAELKRRAAAEEVAWAPGREGLFEEAGVDEIELVGSEDSRFGLALGVDTALPTLLDMLVTPV